MLENIRDFNPISRQAKGSPSYDKGIEKTALLTQA